MTLIKSIVAKGFKSFAKRTELLFENGYNVIIGPNGSGKSNVADAICFVLGKSSAKSLRAEKSANLIYHGGKKGKPFNEAEVNLVFDNSKKTFSVNEKEIKLSRIVRKNGNSIYKLNDKTVTRQQVVDLLMSANIDPDGHNIMLQGDIVRFMEMKPDDRREVIEEISGISIFEEKKAKSLNELNKVDDKLNEAGIILTEREAYLRELKKERDQALKYKELENAIKDNKATHIHLQIKEKQSKKEELEKRIKEQNSEVNKINKKINQLKEYNEKKKLEIKNINDEVEEKGEVEQKKLHKDIEDLKTNLVKNNSREETCTQEIQKIDARKKQLERNIQDTEEKINSLNKEKSVLSQNKNSLIKEDKSLLEEINKYKKKYNINPEELNNIDKGIDRLQQENNSLLQKKQTVLREVDKVNFELNNFNIDENQEDISKIKNLRQDLKKINDELTKKTNEQTLLQTKINTSRNLLIQKSELLFRLNAKQEGIQERLIDSIAMKKILNLNDPKVHGVVYELGKVNSKYSMALEVAAGSRMKSIVVEDDVTASKCIKVLKESKLGVVTFLPLNKIKAREVNRNISKKNGVVGLAIDLVKYDEKFDNVFSYVFGNTLVVNNLETARKLGIGRTRMVTLEGDLVELSGAMVGGFRRKGVGFKEKEVTEDISKLNNEVSELKKNVDILDKRRLEIENKMIYQKENRSSLEGDLLKYEKVFGNLDLNELKSRKKSLNDELKSKNKELKLLDNELTKNEKDVSKLKDIRLNVRYDDKATQGLNKLEKDRQGIKEQILGLESNIKNINVQLDDMYLQEKERISKIIIESDKEKQDFIQELITLRNTLKKDKQELKEKESVEKKFYNDFKSLFSKRNKINEEINKKEGSVLREEEKIKAVEHRINSISIDKAKFIAELEGLNKEFEGFIGAKIKKSRSLEDLKYEIKKAESSLSNLGNVNLRALEVYEDVGKEHKKLVDKKDKLLEEKQDVLGMIQEIDFRKKEIFMKTFNVINNNFKRIFLNLSRKGEAHLDLEDRDTVFNAGMDIKVKLVGNKYLDIRSLSGGEKTLAALAFIFAIQEHQPASFYLMDEVDAALDKTNSELLNNLIAKYSDHAQYIVISHNDAVISGAQQIYGVSMQDEITKVVSLKV
tara:strand:- start:1930 stop:5334 length:3405 start_codon:yes stop_codon:yes gene_type:complete